MDEQLRQMLENLPEDEPRSRLEPFRDFILRWRRQGRSYHTICKILADKCGVKVSYPTLYYFVQRRSRPRKAQPESQAAPIVIATSAPPLPVPADPAVTGTPRSRRSPDEIAAMREAASAANHKPLYPPEERKPRFVYDPTRPLTNKPPTLTNKPPTKET